VRAVLASADDGYPDLDAVALRLSMSSRTLKRRLGEQGFGFRKLLDEVRLRDSVRLLRDTSLSVEQVALRVGYTAPGNFIRAFRGWTGTTPSAFRNRVGKDGAG
jgi:AraC-like DNA-binding protein